MIDLSWNIDADDREEEITGTPRPLLGTWHYLRTSLRRERKTWIGLGVCGALLGLAVLLLLPPSSKATVTLLMAHPASLDGPSAMGTDVSLLNTREVADRTVRQLRLPLTPEQFQATISSEPVTTEILMITVDAPNDAAALSRAGALTRQYLDFRAAQLSSLSSGLIDGYQKRITGLNDEVNKRTTQYNRLVKEGAATSSQAQELIAQRAGFENQIYDLQQLKENASLSTDAAVSSTHVVDQPRLIRHSMKRTVVLGVGSGLVLGTALGVGFVLFRALTSDRVRRRHDVALALAAPVRFSVASLGPVKGVAASLLPWRRRRRGWRGNDLETLVHGLTAAVLTPGGGAGTTWQGPAPTGGRGPSQGLALAAVGNARAAAAVLVALAAHLESMGLAVFLVDLSPSGALASDGGRRGASFDVLRPDGVPGLARGPRGGEATMALPLRPTDPWHERWAAADVVLVLAQVDPGIDAENLATWVPQVVPLVTAGLSTPELLETTGELVRAAGLSLPFALMVGSDSTDQSVGHTGATHAPPTETEVERTASMGQR
ncbi:Chain length determinant protein [Pedococcus cremeus]|uniref:Chain length determinant protein n=1 Tax=Pedococcus cremeus TaxID=587636 RepID=A0A1H9XUM7_9MICO|nr:hypothetical protein [Pedococcus cremeus]SES49882.1 Chain length determinant protein [Pedococcus cremeus]